MLVIDSAKSAAMATAPFTLRVLPLQIVTPSLLKSAVVGTPVSIQLNEEWF